MKLKDIALIGIMAAFICVMAPLAVPIGPVPISLATFAVALVSAVLGWKRGVVATAIYMILGAAGLPVFAGFTAGLTRLAGVTGGYIWGYLLLSLAAGLFADRAPERFIWYPVGMVAGTVLLYVCGTVWFCAVTKTAPLSALSVCVFPFLPGDAFKIAAASLAGFKIRGLLSKRVQV